MHLHVGELLHVFTGGFWRTLADPPEPHRWVPLRVVDPSRFNQHNQRPLVLCDVETGETLRVVVMPVTWGTSFKERMRAGHLVLPPEVRWIGLWCSTTRTHLGLIRAADLED